MSRNPNDVKLTPPPAAPINPSLQQKSGASCFMQSTKAFFFVLCYNPAVSAMYMYNKNEEISCIY